MLRCALFWTDVCAPINTALTTVASCERPTADSRSRSTAGWIHALRDHKGIFFLDLRDRYGITQVVAGEGEAQALRDVAATLRPESTVTVHGTVRERPASNRTSTPTGEIEVVAEKIDVHSLAAPLPFQVSRDDSSNEDLRLKYRFFDLRRARMQRNIAL